MLLELYINTQVADPDHPQPFKLPEPHHRGQRQQLQQRLSFTAIFLPLARSSAALPYYKALEKMDLTVDNVTVVAMELGKVMDNILAMTSLNNLLSFC